jgi:phage head maturation protease
MARKGAALDWALNVKRFAFNPKVIDESGRWQKRGNVYTLKRRGDDLDTDKWTTGADMKSLNKLEAGEKLRIGGTANANIIDRVQERLDPRGLDAVDYLRNPQILAHHSYYCPVGQVDVLDIQDDGVHFNGWVGDPVAVGGPQGLTDMQREMRSLVAQKIIKTVSVGFIPHKFRAPLYSDQGEMIEPLVIESWELLEISLVAVPCNQLSLIEMRADESTGTSKAQRHLNLSALPIKKEDIASLKRILG